LNWLVEVGEIREWGHSILFFQLGKVPRVFLTLKGWYRLEDWNPFFEEETRPILEGLDFLGRIKEW